MCTKNLLWLILLCTFFVGNSSAQCSMERKCKTSRIHGLRSSDCYRLDLKEFPKCLPSNIEVIDLSYNRIRKVSNQDLQRYPYIAHLYLTDNLFVNLEDNTFSDLTSLETLDLSVNALGKVPPTIFQLPSLKSLYLSQNKNMNIAESIEDARPIAHSSLTRLDISYITEEGASTNFPDFRELPLLAFLNISGDQFNQISTRHFAGLCNLQILESENVTAEYEKDCDCWKINSWLKERKVKFTALLCPISERDCQDQQIDSDDLEIFQQCKERLGTIEREMLLSKIRLWIGVASAGIFVIVAILIYRKWRNRRQLQREKEAARNESLQRDHLQPLNQSKV